MKQINTEKRNQKEGGKEHMMNVIMDPAMLYFLDFNILIFLCDFEYLIQINYKGGMKHYTYFQPRLSDVNF